MAGATLSLASLLGWGVAPARAEAPAEMPRYLRQLSRAVDAGDWTLQCNSAQLCQIIGVVTPPRDHIGVRTVVMIARGPAPGAAPRLRMAFLDSSGALAVPPPEDHWRLIPRGRLRGTAALPLGLGPMEADGAYRASPEAAAALIAALRRWPGAAVHDGERIIARMPRGNLERLMGRMDRLQHPGADPLSPAERAQWLQEYHYVTLRSAIEDNAGAAPDPVEDACSARALPNRPSVHRIGPNHRLWIAWCPEGSQIFLQPDGGEATHFEVRDTNGVTQRHDYAGMDGDSLLELQLPKGDRIDCGRWLKFGWSGERFEMILEARYARCRMVPYEFWPRVWYPTSWRYADATPSDGGNAPLPDEGVNPP